MGKPNGRAPHYRRVAHGSLSRFPVVILAFHARLGPGRALTTALRISPNAGARLAAALALPIASLTACAPSFRRTVEAFKTQRSHQFRLHRYSPTLPHFGCFWIRVRLAFVDHLVSRRDAQERSAVEKPKLTHSNYNGSLQRLRVTLGGVMGFRFLHGSVSLAVLATFNSGWGAEPYLTKPPELASCTKPDIKLPNNVTSLYYPSDECGLIYVGPPSTIKGKQVAIFASGSDDECSGIDVLLKQATNIRKFRASVAEKITSGQLTGPQMQEEKGKVKVAEELISDGLADDYKAFGSKATLSLTQDWQANVQAYKKENPDYSVYPLPTVAGVLTFQEKVQAPEFENFGIYDNPLKVPYIDFTVIGLPPLESTSTLLDGNKVPIYFPAARTERANLKTINFGGGAVSAEVTLNKYGYCSFKAINGNNLASFISPTVDYSMALKTFGSYEVHIKSDFALKILKTLSQETSGTYSALALADDLFTQRSSNTIDILLNNDLTNSLSPDKRDGFIQTALIDVANQFLTAVTGVAGEKRSISLPQVGDVSPYQTVQKIQRVCNSSGGFLGIGKSTNCYDQAYNVQVLQNTSKYQQAEAIVKASFSGTAIQRVRNYIVVPWNAALE